jgi:hypothetical protein
VVLGQLPEADQRLLVELNHGGAQQEVVPIDISLTGIRVASPHSPPAGSSVVLYLGEAGNTVQIAGRVVRCSPNEAAIHFAHPKNDPPLDLVRLIRRLEIAWLRSRPRVNYGSRVRR